MFLIFSLKSTKTKSVKFLIVGIFAFTFSWVAFVCLYQWNYAASNLYFPSNDTVYKVKAAQSKTTWKSQVDESAKQIHLSPNHRAHDTKSKRRIIILSRRRSGSSWLLDAVVQVLRYFEQTEKDVNIVKEQVKLVD